MRRPRITRRYLGESAILARGVAHVLEVLRARHPDRDETRLALRCVTELEVELTAQTARLSAAAASPEGTRT